MSIRASLKYLGHYSFDNLLTRMVFFVLLTTIVLVILSNILTFRSVSRPYQEEIDQSYANIYSILQSQFDGLYSDIEQISDVLVRNRRILNFLSLEAVDMDKPEDWAMAKEINEFLYLMTPPLFDSIFVYSERSGWVISSKQGVIDGYRLNDPRVPLNIDWNARGIQYFSGTEKDAIGTESSRYFITLFSLGNDRGAVAVSILTRDLETLIRSYTHGLIHDFYLLHGRETIYRMNSGSATALPGELLENLSLPYNRGDLFSEGFLFHSAPSWISEWNYVTVISQGAYGKAMDALTRTLLIIITLNILAAVFFSVMVSFKLYEPISKMMNIAEHPELWREISREVKSDNPEEVRVILNTITRSEEQTESLENELSERLTLLKRSQAQVLQNQIKPHFLYNTLQAISWLILDQNPDEDSAPFRANHALCHILKNSLKTNSGLTTLEEEAELTRDYISLMQLRYPGSIEYDISLPDRLKPCLVPRFILQPVVENALAYGFDENKKPLTLKIRAEAEKAQLCLTIQNTGRLITKEEAQKLTEVIRKINIFTDDHVGLNNISRRLRLLYGEETGVTIGVAHGATEVKITLPEDKKAPRVREKRE